LIKSITHIIFILAFSFGIKAQIVQGSLKEIEAPNGQLGFQFYQKQIDDGVTQMYYQVSFNNQPVILESELGILIENNLFESALAIENDHSTYWCENLELKSISGDTVADSWKPVYGERSVVKNHYNQLTLHFNKFGEKPEIEEGHNGTNYDKRRRYNMDLIVRVYDEGIAFRYRFPETSNGLFLHIVGEQTSYTLPDETMAYYERWAQGPYSYLPLNNWPDESERPLTLDLKNGLHVALLEAEMIDYSRGKFKLSEEKANTINLSMYDKVDVITPYATPWRVIMVAEKPGELLENNDIVLNLNKPNQIENTSWIKPGKVIRSNLSTKEAKECVDFAAQHHLQYVHLDAGWYGPEMKVSSDATTISKEKDIDIQELVNYAANKNIGVFVYINQRALTDKLDEVFAQCRKWGVKGVKFGFVQIGSSRWSNWLHKAIEKAAEYHLLVDIHDEYRPTGFSRTYPNLMTQEGIRGNEEMPDATHNTILPFTRYLAGAGDYTICYYNNRIKTTHAHQLALSVVYYSPIQFLYWYDKPSVYKGEPEIAFFDAVPTVWDDTKVLHGDIGNYVTIARKSHQDWFIGTITNNEARNIEISLDFLDEGAKYEAFIYFDDDSVKTKTKVGIKKIKVQKGKKISLNLSASGGAAIQIKKSVD
jgi:alpha-glucosidase